MTKEGANEGEIPKRYRNKVVSKTRKGPVGAIVLREMTGLDRNKAYRIVKQFEENIAGDKEDVAEKLEALGERLGEKDKALVIALRQGGKKTLARVLAETGVEPTVLLKRYAEGCKELGAAMAAAEAYRNLPGVIKSMVKHTMAKTGLCGFCAGSGTLHKRAGDSKETLSCNFCGGSGLEETYSDHYEFATRNLLELTEQVGKREGTKIAVGVGVGVKMDMGGSGGGGSFMERLVATSDEILYGSKPAPAQDIDVIDAEVTTRTTQE